MKPTSSIPGPITVLLSVITLAGCIHDGGQDGGAGGPKINAEPLCEIAPYVLSLAVTAVTRGRENFEEVNAFVGSQATGEVISSGCKALVTGMINRSDQTIPFDLEASSIPSTVRTVTAATLVQCLAWASSDDQQRCFSGEIPPPR